MIFYITTVCFSLPFIYYFVTGYRKNKGNMLEHIFWSAFASGTYTFYATIAYSIIYLLFLS